MNYIELLNQFWQTRRRVRLSANEADLYYFLLNESNCRMWENPFECSNTLICATIGMSEKTLIDVRNRLQQKGLIAVEPGQRKKKSPVYTLFYTRTESIKESTTKGITNSIQVGKTPNIILNKTTTQTTTEQEGVHARFVPPTLSEVTDYFVSSKNMSPSEAHEKAGNFYHFYNSKNWMVGKNKMSNWKSAATKSLGWTPKGAAGKACAADHNNQKKYVQF